MSDHHPSISNIDDTYLIGPHVGYFNEYHENDFIGLDERKAYTQCLINIREIPIFSYFDIYKPYDNENIEELTYYIIEIEEYSNELSIMFKEKISRVFGYILKSINFKYKILYFSKT